MKAIEVVAAIIRKGDAIFATQRGYGEWKDYWEAPGGKVEPGESPVQALRREIREELDTEISIDKFLTTIEWDYPKFHLKMHCYMCSRLTISFCLSSRRNYRELLPDLSVIIKTFDQVIEIVHDLVKEFVHQLRLLHFRNIDDDALTHSSHPTCFGMSAAAARKNEDAGR